MTSHGERRLGSLFFRVAAFVVFGTLLGKSLPEGRAGAEEAGRFSYSYDAAGRLVRIGDGSGKYVAYRYDDSGNLLRSTSVQIWQVQTKAPNQGAWVLYIGRDGEVSGFGADVTRAYFEIRGNLSVLGKEVSGTVELVEFGGANILASFTLVRSTVGRDRKTDEPVLLKLRSQKTVSARGLKAIGVVPAGVPSGFQGTYASPKNKATVGKEKSSPGEVVFAPEGIRPAFTLLTGSVTGMLVRDARGRAYGELSYEGETFIVSAKLKDGAKSVRAKTAKGAPTSFSLKVRR